jgi:D-sedoheptulose 7-phosphate isomerase
VGNGGSAATASHFVCDLVKTARGAGMAPMRAFALVDNVPLLTAWANDCAYERSFAEQILALVEPGDIVVVISASGNSPNVVAALAAASTCGARTIGLLGFDGGAVRDLVDVAVHIPCDDYGLVEDAHAAIAHAMTTAIGQMRC